jgi:hypothetical protein
MADSVIFPDQIPDWTPNNNDRILFSATNEAGATKDTDLASLPISTATQKALNNKVEQTYVDSELAKKQNTLIPWTNITIVWDTINSLWWPSVVTDWFNTTYFETQSWTTEYQAQFDFTEDTNSVLVIYNWNFLVPTKWYTESWDNKIELTFNPDDGWDLYLLTWIKWDKWDTWEQWANITTAEFDWNDIKFTKSDWTTVTLVNAKVELKWDKWDQWNTWPQGIQWIKWDKGDKWDQWDKGDKW